MSIRKIIVCTCDESSCSLGCPAKEREEVERMARKQFPLRSKDVAHILDMCPDDVIELARSKKLKATRQGGFWRFNITDVEAYRRRNSNQA